MKTDITLILDRSGSMEGIALDTIGGVNRFLADQQAVPGEAAFSMVQFDDRYEIVYAAVPIAKADPLTTKTFVPRGSTALLDAIGRTIDETGRRLASMPASYRPDKVIVVIVTDGYENASTSYSVAQVNHKIAHQRDAYQWEFIFLGANQDAISSAAAIGIPQFAAMTYTASAAGTRGVYDVVSDTMRSVRSGQATAMAFSVTDRAKAAGDVTLPTTADPITDYVTDFINSGSK